MSHYNVNASVPKTLIQYLVRWVAETGQLGARRRATCCSDILATEISPELVPGDGRATQPGRGPKPSSAPTSCRISTSTTSLRFGYRADQGRLPRLHAPGATATRGDWPDIPDAIAQRVHASRDQALAARSSWRFFKTSQFKRTLRAERARRWARAARSRRAATGARRATPKPPCGWSRWTKFRANLLSLDRGDRPCSSKSALARFAQHLMTTAPVPMRLQLWTGLAYDLGPTPAVTVKVKEPSAVRALVAADFSDLGEAFIREQIDVEGPILEAMRAADALVHGARPRARTWTRLRRAVGHSRKQDAKAIEHHYDVSNEFYALWLDPRMVYSCAYFRTRTIRSSARRSRSSTTSAASSARARRALPRHRLRLGRARLPGGRSNYGVQRDRHHALAKPARLRAASGSRRAGSPTACEVRAARLPRPARRRARYDKIASVGMFEHVGLRTCRSYFGKIQRLLDARRARAEPRHHHRCDPQSRLGRDGGGELHRPLRLSARRAAAPGLAIRAT